MASFVSNIYNKFFKNSSAYDKEQCPILIMLEDIYNPITSRTLRKLIPTLKEKSFLSIALEEMSSRSSPFIINLYSSLALNEILTNIPKQYSSMYSLLKKAQNNQFTIHNIDYDYDKYNSMNIDYLNNKKLLSIEVNKKLIKEHDAVIKSSISENAEDESLKQDLISSFFTKDKDKSQIKALQEHNSRKYFQHQEFIEFVKKLLDEPFNAGRSEHFAIEIDKICQKHQHGIAVLLGSFHGKTAKILKDLGYDVKSYHIRDNQEIKHFVENLLIYNFDWANEHMFYNSTTFFDQQNNTEESIIDQIKSDISCRGECHSYAEGN
jgi:hypothetical protein